MIGRFAKWAFHTIGCFIIWVFRPKIVHWAFRTIGPFVLAPIEVADRFEFLRLTEQPPTPHCLIFMHIYADGNEQSCRLNDALLELTGRLSRSKSAEPSAKFYKVQTKVLGTTQKFARDALPALQIYQAEQLIGNFIRLTTELGDDYDTSDLLRFLRRNGIPLDSLFDD